MIGEKTLELVGTAHASVQGQLINFPAELLPQLIVQGVIWFSVPFHCEYLLSYMILF